MTDPTTDRSPDAAAAGADAEATAGRIAADDPATVALRLLEDQKEKHLRLAAEYENFRKRTARERLEAERRGQADVVRGLLDALDDLLRFSHVDPAALDARTLHDGIVMVERKLFKSLAGHGLEVLDPVGHAFDPQVHEAVGTQLVSAREDDHLVAQVYQVGYRFHGQLLRPARVVVKQYAEGAGPH